MDSYSLLQRSKSNSNSWTDINFVTDFDIRPNLAKSLFKIEYFNKIFKKGTLKYDQKSVSFGIYRNVPRSNREKKMYLDLRFSEIKKN